MAWYSFRDGLNLHLKMKILNFNEKYETKRKTPIKIKNTLD